MATTARSDGVRVLVVDDDEDLRAELVDVLEDAGYTVVQARNGRDGLARLETMPPPNVVLLDLMMPEMSGEQMLTELRKNAVLASVPVILMSAYHERASELRHRVQGLLEKPVRAHVVIETVEHVRAMQPLPSAV